jgi:uncharacterized protein
MSDRPSQGRPPRLVPDERLPPYSYVTARFPHPTRDPAGHSFGHLAEDPPPLDPNRWQESRAYLWGCDLFNHGYYWEAHETWEAAWKACGRRGRTADFLKGLIKLAAAGVKAREGRPAGVARHGARAGQLFRAVAGELAAATYLGLDLNDLIAHADRLEQGIELAEPTAAPVAIVFDFQLCPR